MKMSWQQAFVLVAGMGFVFFWVRQGLGDVDAGVAALGAGALAAWNLFQRAGGK